MDNDKYFVNLPVEAIPLIKKWPIVTYGPGMGSENRDVLADHDAVIKESFCAIQERGKPVTGETMAREVQRRYDEQVKRSIAKNKEEEEAFLRSPQVAQYCAAVDDAHRAADMRAVERVAKLGTQAAAALAGPQAVRPAVDNQQSPARHSPDFRSVVWFGKPYTFTKNQAKCVRLLWEAWEKGTPDLDGLTVVTQAAVSQARLIDVFKSKGKMHAAWRSMIVSRAKGAYRLAEHAAVASECHSRKTPRKTPRKKTLRK